jgi:hypothetical protein
MLYLHSLHFASNVGDERVLCQSRSCAGAGLTIRLPHHRTNGTHVLHLNDLERAYNGQGYQK